MKMRVLAATITALGDGGPRSNRGHLCPFKKPTTPAVFIDGGELEKVMGHFHTFNI